MDDDENSYVDKTNGQNALRLNARSEPEIDYEMDYSKANKSPQILAALAGNKSFKYLNVRMKSTMFSNSCFQCVCDGCYTGMVVTRSAAITTEFHIEQSD
jgi:hypothetical protein